MLNLGRQIFGRVTYLMNYRAKYAWISLSALLLWSLIWIGWNWELPRNVHAQTANSANAYYSNTNQAPPPPPVEDDFVPELGDLPTYDELADYESDRSSAAMNLIDVSDAKATDEPWPSFSNDEIEGVRSGEKWLGLYARGVILRLEETVVTRDPRKGYVGPGDLPRDWLKFEKKGDLLFLVRGLPNLRPSAVTTLLRHDPNNYDSLDVGFRKPLKLNGKTYVLRVTSGLQRDGGRVNVLLLEAEGKSQVVAFNMYYKDHNTLYNTIGELLWGGDMDGDGKLDLYLSHYGFEKGGGRTSLYLSSAASGEDLVKEVGSFSSGGC